MTEIQKLTSTTAQQIPQLVYKVFGYTYSDEVFYSPEALVQTHADGKYISYLSVDGNGDVQALLSLYLDYTPRLARVELLLSDPSLPTVVRALAVAKIVETFRKEVPSIRDTRMISGILSMETTAHSLTQRIVVQTGFVPCGLYLGFLPSGFWRSGADRQLVSPHLRTSSTLSMLWVDKARKPYRVRVPCTFAEIIKTIYDECRLPVSLDLETPDPRRGSDCELEQVVDVRWSRAVIKLVRVGSNACNALVEALSHYKRGLIEIMHFFLPITEMDISDIVETLLDRGCRFAALIPGYGPEGEDVLVLQYLNGVRHDTPKEHLYAPLSRKIFAVVQ